MARAASQASVSAMGLKLPSRPVPSRPSSILRVRSVSPCFPCGRVVHRRSLRLRSNATPDRCWRKAVYSVVASQVPCWCCSASCTVARGSVWPRRGLSALRTAAHSSRQNLSKKVSQARHQILCASSRLRSAVACSKLSWYSRAQRSLKSWLSLASCCFLPAPMVFSGGRGWAALRWFQLYRR